jgi:hypothetical protein
VYVHAFLPWAPAVDVPIITRPAHNHAKRNALHHHRGTLADAVMRNKAFHSTLADGSIGVNLSALLEVLLAVAHALRYMHGMGLVHGDIKVCLCVGGCVRWCGLLGCPPLLPAPTTSTNGGPPPTHRPAPCCDPSHPASWTTCCSSPRPPSHWATSRSWPTLV